MPSSSEAGRGTEPAGWEEIDLYRFFAFLFGAPTRERFQWFQQRELAPSLAHLWTRLGCPGAFSGVTSFRTYGEYESTYIALFDVGVPQPPVPLLESAHDQAQAPQQTALENTSFYEVLGLATDTSRYAPDHLVTQLEFLSAVRYTGENTPNEENRSNLARLERDFLQRHLLNWVPTAEKKLRQTEAPVFPVLLTLLSTFLRRQADT
jgi:DMSO reductase family type II enzyme chaperone